MLVLLHVCDKNGLNGIILTQDKKKYTNDDLLRVCKDGGAEELTDIIAYGIDINAKFVSLLKLIWLSLFTSLLVTLGFGENCITRCKSVWPPRSRRNLGRKTYSNQSKG
jgi:hypothetical protein